MTITQKRILLSSAALMAIAGIASGVFFWQKNAHPDPAVINFPDKVCGGALSGHAVSSLFPQKGENFVDGKAAFAKSGIDECMMAAGGRKVDLRLYPHYDSSAAEWADGGTWKDSPGYTKISLGGAVGYAGNRFATLNYDCKSPLRGRFVLSVWVNYYEMKDGDLPTGKRKEFIELAAEALKFSAGKQGQRCEQAAEIPAGPPALG